MYSTKVFSDINNINNYIFLNKIQIRHIISDLKFLELIIKKELNIKLLFNMVSNRYNNSTILKMYNYFQKGNLTLDDLKLIRKFYKHSLN